MKDESWDGSKENSEESSVTVRATRLAKYTGKEKEGTRSVCQISKYHTQLICCKLSVRKPQIGQAVYCWTLKSFSLPIRTYTMSAQVCQCVLLPACSCQSALCIHDVSLYLLPVAVHLSAYVLCWWVLCLHVYRLSAS